MKISIQMLSLGSTELFFLFDQAHHPAIEVKGIRYTSLGQLIQALPELTDKKHIDKLAQIANFLAKSLEFQYIEDIENFKESYLQQLEADELNLLQDTLKLRDYGIFDLSVMHPPHLIDHKLVFFVKHDYLSIPYKASLFTPIHIEGFHLSYELLPLL